MTDQQPAEGESQAPLQVGVAQLGDHLDPEQVRDIVRHRLEYLVGGVYLSDEEIDRLTHRLSARRYAAGETIISRGVPGEFMGVVAEGQVAVHSPPETDAPPAPEGDSLSVLLLPGSTFGEAMLIDGRPAGSTVRAATDAELYILRREDYVAVADQPSAQPVGRSSSLLRWLAAISIVLLIAAAAAGIYYGLDPLLSFVEEVGQVRQPAISVPAGSEVQIVAPLEGEIVQHSTSLPVRAMVAVPGFYQAELQVDGMRRSVQVNRNPQTVPWVVEWPWDEVDEGSHTLTVQAHGPDGEWAVSRPITVTVVPTGTLAFSSNRDGSNAVYTVRTDGRGPKRLTTGPGDARQPAWGKDAVLAFVAEPRIGPAVVRTMPVGGEEVVDLLVGRDPAWSSDGTLLAYATTMDGVSQIFTTTVPGAGRFQVTTEEVYAGQPTWSPDGGRVAYVAEREGNWDIWVTGPEDGDGDPLRLTDDPAMDWSPAWSPDGSQLAFVSERGGSHQIYVMQSDGSDVRRLTDLPLGAESPAWSPDGYWLTFVAYTGDGTGVNAREIHLMRANGRDQVRLTHNAFDDAQPDWR